MRVTLQEELDQLEAALQEEGAHVLRALRGALNALVQTDVELADEVIAFDDEVDAALPRASRRASSRSSRARRRSRSTSGSCSRSCTTTSTSSGWPTTA